MFVGYEDNCPKGANMILDLKNNITMITRDVRWFGKCYGEYFNLQNKKIMDDTQ